MNTDFFTGNRQALQDRLGHGLVVMTAFTSLQRSNDAAFGFEQEANFWYVTGITDPDWWVIIDGSSSWLVAPTVSDVHALFDGQLSPHDAKKISGVDQVIDQPAAEVLLAKLAKKYDTVHTIGKDPHAAYHSFAANPAPDQLRRRLRKLYASVSDCRPVLAGLRAIKQPAEIAAIRSAIQITVDAFAATKTKLSTLTYEYEVESEFSHHFTRHGNNTHAYDPIVAFGANACTLHYGKNSDHMDDGLLLIDIGARVDGYAADITRTYAVGVVTERQRAVHAAVAAAHQQIIDLLCPGLSVVEYHEKVDAIMNEQLDQLGLITQPSDYRKYFPHAVSHGLGIDVHDALGRPDTFMPGMVLTVEPGIYIPEEGIGVRIEDDILITADGHDNLSAALPIGL